MKRILLGLGLSGWLVAAGALASAKAAELPLVAPDAGEISPQELDTLLAAVHKASNTKDLEGVRQLLWDDAQLLLISKGEMMEFTLQEYMDILKDTWGQTTSYTYEYQKEDCQVNGARTRCTGTVRETMVLTNGQFLTSSVKGEDIFEKRNGVVKIIYSKANTDEATVGSRPSPNVPLEILQKQK